LSISGFWAPRGATSYSSVSPLLMRYSLLYYRSTLLLVRNLSGRKGHADNGVRDALMLTVNHITSA